MIIQTVAGTRTLSGEPPRSTAYYYADLERLKKKNGAQTGTTQTGAQTGADASPGEETRQNPDELSEYVESNEVVNDGAIREVPPFRDRQWSLPEYHTPENVRKIEETYSTAGTFPMPEPKEKEPLLAELEIVGRLPLRQLDASSGVRRSRSWYLCCPNVEDEEISRESSWRYSSLRPVTAPPLPGQNGLSMLTTQSSNRVDDVSSIRAERDALARALAAERQRAASDARAHDARLAELHGVIAELVRRRAADKSTGAIPEEEVSDECESTTQPAGELDHDADRSRTDQNDTSSIVSPSELPTPQEPQARHVADDTTDTSSRVEIGRCEPAAEPATSASGRDSSLRLTEQGDSTLCLPDAGSGPRRRLTQSDVERYDSSLHLTDRDSRLCVSTPGCKSRSRAGSCERDHGSNDEGMYCLPTHHTGGCESRQAKLASRVRLKRTEESDHTLHLDPDEAWCAETSAHDDLREALLAAARTDHEVEMEVCLCGGGAGASEPCACCSGLRAWRARSARLAADTRVLRCALARAADTQHRLWMSCAVQESCCVSLCCALRAADRALETYDVLLALAETAHTAGQERSAAELVASQLLSRLEEEHATVSIGEPLLSPGPWLQHHNQVGKEEQAWSAELEARLRAHAARLKADTVLLRLHADTPKLFSYHDIEDEDVARSSGDASMAEMEAAVMMQEVLSARENRAVAQAEAAVKQQNEPARSRRRRERHWLESQASETDL